MEKPNRVRHLYGYTVCLVAVVTALISINGAVRNVIDLSDPLRAASNYGDDLSSFDAWLASRTRFSSEANRDTATAPTLQRRFDALKESKIAEQRFRARKELIAQVILLVVAVALFATHWRWLRRWRDDDLPAAT
jgi:hypothetical protein